MYRIKLVNMPFAALRRPSLALTQLRAVVAERCGAGVATEICYVNHDFGRHLGVNLYSFVANTGEANTSGLGDWFFRQAAFPSLPDNTGAYFRRYFARGSGPSEVVRRAVLEARPSVDALLDRVIHDYALDEADLVGFTSMFAQNVASFALSRRLKELSPDTLVAIGGANCEAPMGQQIADHVRSIDFVFSGPALRSFPEFVERARRGELDACASIPGVLRASRRRMLTTPGACGSMGEDLDIDHPVALEFDDFRASLSRHFPGGEVEPSLLFETSRGCWWGERAHCTFCGLNGSTMGYRSMRPDLAIGLLNDVMRAGSRVPSYESVDNIMPRNYPREVFPHVRVPADATLFYEVKADLPEEDLAAMSRAGVRLIQPGIEALATSTLKLMKKGCSSFQNIELLKRCVQHDIAPMWNLLVGFPGEEESVYRQYVEQLPRLTHLPPPSGVFPIRFDRYSPYFTRAAEYGLDLRSLDFYDLVYPLPQEALRHLAYYFEDRAITAPYFVAMASWIGRLDAVVHAWRQRWLAGGAGDFPRLYFEREGPVVDARGATPARYPVAPLGRRILAALETPLSGAMLSRTLPEVADGALDVALGELDGAGLLFRDGERIMSLVHAARPQPPATILRMLAPPPWHAWLHGAPAPGRTGAILPSPAASC